MKAGFKGELIKADFFNSFFILCHPSALFILNSNASVENNKYKP
jgi:hypothetical protein